MYEEALSVDLVSSFFVCAKIVDNLEVIDNLLIFDLVMNLLRKKRPTHRFSSSRGIKFRLNSVKDI